MQNLESQLKANMDGGVQRHSMDQLAADSQKIKMKPKRVRNPVTTKLYNRSKLGYREQRSESRMNISKEQRIQIIYDSVVHKKSVLQLVQEYSINYCTIRHLLLQYHLCGKTSMRKFKQIDYQSAVQQVLQSQNYSTEAQNE